MSEEGPSTVNHWSMIADVFRVINGVLDCDCKMYLFGSFARGEERASSDIDVAVDVGEPLPLIHMTEIRARLEDSNIPFRVDVIDLNQTSELFRRQIIKEGIQWKE